MDGIRDETISRPMRGEGEHTEQGTVRVWVNVQFGGRVRDTEVLKMSDILAIGSSLMCPTGTSESNTHLLSLCAGTVDTTCSLGRVTLTISMVSDHSKKQ